MRFQIVVLAMLAWTQLAEAQGQPATGEAPSRPVAREEASSRHRLRWRWRRAGVLDYAAIALVGGAYLYLEFGAAQGTDPRWTGGVLFDHGARHALRAGSREGRNRAAHWSDALALAPPVLTLADTLLVPLADHGNWDVLWQLSVIDLEAGALTALLTRGSNRVARRARPDVAECEIDPEYDDRCFDKATESFPSGHTSAAFVAAGLSCAHHWHLPLYGGNAADVAACVATTTFATSAGVLRIVADRHYASDVLVGALIGAGAGFALPMTLSYREAAKDGVEVMVLPLAEPGLVGMAAHGRF